MSPSLDKDCTIQDLAFQVLKLLGQRISTLDPYRELCLSWLGLPRHEHKWTWLSRLGSHRSEILHCFSRLGMPSFELLHFWTACPQVLIDNDYSRLGFPSLEMLLHGLFFGEHVLAWDVHSLSLPYLAKIKNIQAGFLVVWCVLLGSLNVIPNSWRSRSAPHATLAGRRLLHFIVWVFSLGFLMFMFMFNDCGPHSCDYKKT